MRISFIGSGNVATHLAKAFYKAGHSIVQIYSKTFEHAQLLAGSVQAESIHELHQLSDQTDLFIISIPDQYISEVSAQLPKHIAQVHTSGNTALTQLKGDITGVFYPLQTFTKEKPVDFSELNILLESNHRITLENLKQLATSVNSNIHLVSSESRQKLHVAAVFACNFSNVMVDIAQDILKTNHLDTGLLLPLIQETTNKLYTMSANEAQTGPALRKDENTIENHKTILKQFSPSVQEIYKLLTEEIQKRHGKL